jgi:hypothetical protein
MTLEESDQEIYEMMYLLDENIFRMQKPVVKLYISCINDCPIEGKIGEQAKLTWEENKDKIPKPPKEDKYETVKNVGFGSLLGVLVHAAFK